MNKIKIIFGGIILLIIFFVSYNLSLAADGCCIKDMTINGASNCYAAANAAACSGTFQSYPNTCSGLSQWCSNNSSGKATASGDATCSSAGGSSDETCMDVNGEYSPDGYDCTLRGVCPGTQACCKKNTVASTTTPVANANPAATTPAASTGSTSFTNPIIYTNVEGLLGGILSAIQKIIVILALIFIAIGAVMILVSAGSPETVEKGKKAITMAIVGLAIGIAAPSILKELAGMLGWGGVAPAALSLSQIALNVLNFLLGITGVLALIMLVIGAIMYLTSAGDEGRIDTGKKIFKYSLIGIIVVMSSMVLVMQIARFFVAS